MSEHIVFIEASLTGSGEKTCQYARLSGRQVTLVCKDPAKYPEDITDFVDRIIVADTNDAVSIVKQLEAVNRQQKIDGITTTNDFYVIQTAKVAEHFGVPTTPAEQVEVIKNKYLMRKALHKSNPSLNPGFTLAITYEEAEAFAARYAYPFIAKPQDANDSLHVQIIRNPDDLKTYFTERQTWGRNIVGQSFADGVLLEDLIDGPEFCLDVLKPVNGSLICVGAFAKKLAGAETGNFIKIGACFPAPENETSQLFSQISKGLDALGVVVGAVNIDCKIVRGKAKILEINPRLVGDQMGSHMIELATGQNPAHAVVELALGHNFIWKPTANRGVAIHRITMPRSGYFYGIENFHAIYTDPNVAYVNELGTKGQWYDPAKSNQDVVGSVITIGKTPDEAMRVATTWAMNAEVVTVNQPLQFLHIKRSPFNPTPVAQKILAL